MADRAPDSVLTPLRAEPGRAAVACAQCGTSFLPKPRGRNGRFCRSSCRGRWHAARRERLIDDLADALARATVALVELRATRDGSP
jgi:hypothetical protein